MTNESYPATPELRSDREEERRRKRRFPIELEVRYRLRSGQHKSEPGVARTINISSSGVLIDSQTALPTEVPIALSINWPVLLGGLTPMKLLIFGQVMRSNAKGTAIIIERYEFRREVTSLVDLRHRWPRLSLKSKTSSSVIELASGAGFPA